MRPRKTQSERSVESCGALETPRARCNPGRHLQSAIPRVPEPKLNPKGSKTSKSTRNPPEQQHERTARTPRTPLHNTPQNRSRFRWFCSRFRWCPVQKSCPPLTPALCSASHVILLLLGSWRRESKVSPEGNWTLSVEEELVSFEGNLGFWSQGGLLGKINMRSGAKGGGQNEPNWTALRPPPPATPSGTTS
jgi:hypothetical protein